MALRAASLCTGLGMLDLGVRLARPDHRLVVAVERQAYCAAVLVERMAQAELDQAPIWDDLATFDGRPWRGTVDLVTAGYPCQPESLAGSRLGELDERWLWRHVQRVIREMGPDLVFLENVAGHLSGTFGRVLGDLASLGMHVEWDCIPACAVGAPHQRDRVFMLAANPIGLERWLQPVGEPGRCNAAIAARREGTLDGEQAGRTGSDDGTPYADHAGKPPFQWRQDAPPRWPWPPPEPVFRRVDDGRPHRLERDWAERIHALGNGVVPQAAARAWRVLERRMTRRPGIELAPATGTTEGGEA